MPAANPVLNMYYEIFNPHLTFHQASRNTPPVLFYNLFLTAIWLTPSGSSTAHIYTQDTEYREWNIHNNKIKKIMKCGPCPALRVIPWHLPYN
jgi:hypothetical protein